MADLGLLIYSLCFILFLVRIIKLQEQNWTWAIVMFMAGAFIWFGFYFATFQGGSSSTTYPPYNVIVGNAITQYPGYTVNTTTAPSIVAVNSWEFWGLASFTFWWSLVVLLLAIWEALSIIRNGATNALPQNK